MRATSKSSPSCAKRGASASSTGRSNSRAVVSSGLVAVSIIAHSRRRDMKKAGGPALRTSRLVKRVRIACLGDPGKSSDRYSASATPT